MRFKKSILSAFFIFSLIFFLRSDAETTQNQNLTPHILSYKLAGTIHSGTVSILQNMFEEVRTSSTNYQAILIELDTPGGLLDSTEDIVKMFLNSEDIPVIVFVSPKGARAGSAGTFITMSAHVASMAPGTYIGAAHPVMSGGGGDKNDPQQEIMNKKIESAVTSFIESIAMQRGRNKEWAKKAVLESQTLTEDKALKENVIDLIAENPADLLAKIDGREIKMSAEKKRVLKTKEAVITDYKPKPGLLFLNWLATPAIIYLLTLGVILGIYLEVSHPGMIAPGILAVVCFILLLLANRTLPINYVGGLLLFASLALLIAEIFITSYGFLTIGAVACFVAGSLLLFDLPQNVNVFVPFPMIIGASLGLLSIGLVVSIFVLKTFKKKQQAGSEALIGMSGDVVDEIGDEKTGKVFLNGEYWNARASKKIEKGKKIKVLEINGLVLKVE